MRPFTLFESEISTGSIKMSALFNNDSIKTASGKLDLKSLIEIIIKGGWPALNTRDNILTLKDVMTINREYINNISYFDINTVDGIKKDPIKIKLVLRSLARNISTLVKSSTIFRDVQINDKDEVSKITILNYISLLKRLYIVEDVPG
jgi:predicted AAA+ superfamily ATPase